MELPLKNQIALVTGGSSGIGLAIAEAYSKAGARVAIDYVGPDADAANVVAAIEAHGGKALAFKCDVANEAGVQDMFKNIIDTWGTIDILVANAGLQQDSPFKSMTLAQWQTVINVNLTGQFLCARAAINEFIRRGPRPEISKALGKIICMSSVHQVIPWGGHVNYASSKGGIMMMMKSLAQEVAGLGIRVNAIAPGAIRTPINRSAWETKEALARLLTLIPYNRIGEPDDIARAAVWLASEESDYVVGTTLFVDGGMTLYPGFGDNG